MSTQATYDDANLVLRLYELRREEKLRAARDWFMREFKAKTFEDWTRICPQGSQELTNFRMVATYWDMACSFVSGGVLHADLFIHSAMEHLAVYEKVRGALPGLRAQYKNPGYLKNLEAVAKLAADYLERQGPGTYEAFASRWRP
jgi:hypothetical protein